MCLPGQVHFLYPDELHDGGPGTADGFGYRIVYLEPALLRAALGGNELAIPDEALANYPRLREWNGRNVIVGLRAGDLHPAQGRAELPQIVADVELVESLGGESMAYFKVRARQITAEPSQAEEALESEDEESVVGSRPNLVASFPPHVQLRLGDRVAIAVDAKNLHFFDEASGAPLR